MKRSEVNLIIKKLEAFAEEIGFALPPFCRWTPDEWQKKGHEYDEIRENMLGWDVTDYGKGDFDKLGIVLITIRNGNQNNPKYTKPYAEKIALIQEGQISPMHFHWNKMEDIINRGGGNMLVRLYNANEDDSFADTDVVVQKDGRTYPVAAGTEICLQPGESISLYKRLFHEIRVEEGHGPVLLGEVSLCNDDNTDNYFCEPLGRFPTIDEDELPYRLLCTEYPAAKD